MKAVVYHGVGDIRLDDVKEPKLQKDTDAIVRLTSSAICGTDLHIIRGTMGGMKAGTILGHEGVGVVEEVGKQVRNFRAGDRVVIPSTIACGYCSYCRAGYFAQCDEANPKGKHAGTAFFGGPASTGPIQGLQAELARVPFAHVNLVRVPQEISDDEAILVSDIFPTGYFGADLAEIKHGDTVAVFGCGPVGAFAIASAFLHGAGRVLAVDAIPARLDMARNLGAEVIHFNREDPTKVILELTGDIGVDCAIDAVGIDAEPAEKGPASAESRKQKPEFEEEVKKAAPKQDEDWQPGHAPSQALRWAVKSLAKAGTLAVVGVYPETFNGFPFGESTMKNLRINGGNCHHRKYIPKLMSMIRNRTVDLGWILTNAEPLSSAIEAYEAFNRRQAGWIKVKLEPAA